MTNSPNRKGKIGAATTLILISIMLSGCTMPSQTGRVPGSGSGYSANPTQRDLSQNEMTRLLNLVNQARARKRVSPLRYDSSLCHAAQAHSADMAKRNYFSHNARRPAPNGVKISDRVTNSGYQWQTVGENIAKGHLTVEKVFQGWMDSPGHRANILNPGFTEMGFGKAGLYWTQTFGTPR